MAYDHEAIYKVYPDCVKIDDDAGAVKYKTDRLGGTRIDKTGTYYAEIGDQLDMLYKDIVAGKLDTTGTWATHIKAVKDANPKP